MPTDARPPLAAALDAERRAKALTYRALAAASGLPLSRVQSILTGATPNPGIFTLRPLLVALGRDLGWLDRRLRTP